jgi:muconolactone D-isomerase
MEYLVTMTTNIPDGTPDESVADVRAREAAHSSELAMQGQLLRLWRPPLRPGEWRSLGLFAAADDAQLEGVLASDAGRSDRRPPGPLGKIAAGASQHRPALPRPLA